MKGWKPVTQGEHLYFWLVNKFLNDGDALKSALGYFREGDVVGNRSAEFADYCSGLYCFNLTARLIKATRALLDESSGNEHLYRSRLLGFLADHCAITEFRFRRVDVNTLINLAVEAAYASKKDISGAVKRLVRSTMPNLECYICGHALLENATSPDDRIEYEHLWPSSYGGDSTVSNLLPACCHCNRAKASMMLWQDGWEFSLILPPDPSPEALTSITRPMKVALQRRKIFLVAAERQISLKDAALEVGPIDLDSFYPVEPSDATDFFTVKF